VNPKTETASEGNKYIEWSEEMDLSRAVYSRDLKIAAMRALDAGSTTGEIARKYQVSPHLLERWRGEWRARGEMAFPGIGRRGAALPAVDDTRRIAELERKIGQLTMENDFLKKRYSISGSITRQPSSMAPMPV
jgi:transposase